MPVDAEANIIAPPYEAIPAKAPAPNALTPVPNTSVALSEATCMFFMTRGLEILSLSFKFMLPFFSTCTFLNELNNGMNSPISLLQEFNIVSPSLSSMETVEFF